MYYELPGLFLAFLVTLLVIAGVLTMTPLSMIISGLIHASSESWRVLNVVRPVVMMLLGAYYPRFYMPLMARLISYTIPSSHIVESVQRIVTGLTDQWTLLLVAIAVLLALLYTPVSKASLMFWEKKKVSEGVKIS